MRRELSRNGQLRHLIGLSNKVPTPSAYSRFLKKLMELEHREYIQKIFDNLVNMLRVLLDNFGEDLAIDGKPIESFGNPHDLIGL